MSKRVLIVDDDKMVRRMVTMTLEYKDYEVVSAKDGVEALEKIKKNGPFDLVVIDIIMPNMDGFELIKWIRADGKYNSLPLAVLTTEGQEQNRVKAMELGADCYLVKPFLSDSFLERIDGIFKKTDFVKKRVQHG